MTGKFFWRRSATVTARPVAWLAAIGSLAACDVMPTHPAPQPAVVAQSTELTPTAPTQPSDQVGPNDYIVVLRDREGDVAAVSARLARLTSARVKVTWDAAIKGFLAEVPPGAIAALQRDPSVANVSKDQMIYPDVVVQPVPGIWGLDRIGQRLLPLNGTYRYTSTGAGVHVYIIDSGINTGHTQFAGRVGAGVSFVPLVPSVVDCNGHGTHVAGTIGGTTYGVAKGVILHPVRVFDCAGGAPVSRVISAVNWVMLNDIPPAVTNMSLGGGVSVALNAAVNNLVASGNVVVVAAGNSGADACLTSPASAANAITVGSTGEGAGTPPAFIDTRSSFSNWGPCLDLFAPGRSILSAWYTSPVATSVLTGTSMASPHVAGVAARLRQAFPAYTALNVRNSLVANATGGLIAGAGAGSPNLLLYSYYFP